MAQAVNVFLKIGDKSVDLNTMGLIDLTFDRVINNPKNLATQTLANVDILMFDETGNEVLTLLQKANYTLKLRYGFAGNLSDIYELTVVNINTTYNNLGAMVGIKGIATTNITNSGARTFKKGTNVRDILVALARHNGWYIGDKNINEYIDVDVILLDNVYKPETMNDFTFINSVLLPLCNKTVLTSTTTLVDFYDVRLTIENGKPTLYFRKYTNRTTTRRVWEYSYGTSTDNSILSITNQIDYSYLINGISVKIPMTDEDYIFHNTEDKVSELVMSKFELVEKNMKANNIDLPNLNNIRFNIETVPAEELGNITIEQALNNKISEIIQIVNTIDLTVIGNPNIRVSDMIKLSIKTRDGNNSPIASTGGSLWRVTAITEKIGLDGYTTDLKVVREMSN